MSINGPRKKENVACVHSEILLNHLIKIEEKKIEGIQMELEKKVILSEELRPRKTYVAYFHLYVDVNC